MSSTVIYRDVSKVTNLSSMFQNALASNGDMSAWDTSRVAVIDYMFAWAISFKQTICWNTSNVISKTNIFIGNSGASFNVIFPYPLCCGMAMFVTDHNVKLVPSATSHIFSGHNPLTELPLSVNNVSSIKYAILRAQTTLWMHKFLSLLTFFCEIESVIVIPSVS